MLSFLLCLEFCGFWLKRAPLLPAPYSKILLFFPVYFFFSKPNMPSSTERAPLRIRSFNLLCPWARAFYVFRLRPFACLSRNPSKPRMLGSSFSRSCVSVFYSYPYFSPCYEIENSSHGSLGHRSTTLSRTPATVYFSLLTRSKPQLVKRFGVSYFPFHCALFSEPVTRLTLDSLWCKISTYKSSLRLTRDPFPVFLPPHVAYF